MDFCLMSGDCGGFCGNGSYNRFVFDADDGYISDRSEPAFRDGLAEYRVPCFGRRLLRGRQRDWMRRDRIDGNAVVRMALIMKTLLAIFLVAQSLCWAQQTTNQNVYDVRLTYNASPNGYITTTGSISASSHTLTVASATGWGVGMGVLVTGGCVSGCTTQASGTFLWTYVTAISGTTLTLNDAAGASVSGGRVAHDEQRAINAAQAAAYNSGGGTTLLSKDPITGNCVYKVSGPLSATTNSLLTLPQNLNIDDPIRLNLAGQITGYSVDNLTITGGCGIDFTDAPAASGTKPALIAGAPYVVLTSGNFTTSLQAVEYGIDGLYILGPNQSALNGILLNNVVSARIAMNAPVGLATKADSANTWSQPTGGTTALWMPGWLNDVKNSVGEVTISGWNVCHTPGEHEIMSGPYLINCNSAMTFFKAHDLISGTVRIEQVPLMWSVDASVSDEIPINIIADNETNVSVGPVWSRRGTYDLVDTGNHLYGGLSYKIKDETEAYKSINLNGGANLVYCNDGVAPVGGSCGTVITGATTGAIVTGLTASTIQTPSTNATVDSNGNVAATSITTGGPTPTTSGGDYMKGVTSGGVAWAVANIAGTAIVYVLPSTNGAADQVLTDTGSTTCPTLGAGFPTTCHLMQWQAPSAIVPVTGQTANIGQTTFFTSRASNTYYAICAETSEAVAETTSGMVPGVQLIYTSAATGNAVTLAQLSTATAAISAGSGFFASSLGCATIYASASTAVIYQTVGYTSVGATALQYDLTLTYGVRK